MSSPRAGSSQSYGGSQSILVPESPGSPDILNLSSPGSPQVTWQDPDSIQQHSETFTQAVPEFPRVNDESTISNEDSRDSRATVNYDAEDSRSTVTNQVDFPNEDSNETRHVPVSLNLDSHNNNSNDTETISPVEDNNIELVTDAEGRVDEEPPSKMRKLDVSEDMDGETCPICLDSWGNSGEHRLVALKCGHLFGAKCVERWLRAQTVKDRSCPTCKTKSNLKDMRHIYARRLVAADTSQITSLQKQIDVLQCEKVKVELELQKSRLAHRACVLQLEVLRSTLMKSQPPKEQTIRKSWRFSLEKNLEVHKDGGCRVMTYNCRSYELYVSQKSVNYLFPGYGIRKVSCVDYKLGQFVHLHPKPIRDITYSQPKDLLLSVGLDSSARIVERGILSVTVQSETPLWSCSWDYLRGNEFYVGGVGGAIYQYDVRNPNSYIARLQAPRDMSPVVSLYSTEYGLLSCQLNSCWLWVANSRQWEPRPLPVEGPFVSLAYDSESNRALISCRPKSLGERSRLALCKLKASVPRGNVIVEAEQTLQGARSLDVVMETEHTFPGSARSSLMSRTAWVRAPGATWVAAHSESDSTLYLHGLDGARTMSLPASEPALDVCSVQLNGDTLLAALSESRLRLYKAVPTNS